MHVIYPNRENFAQTLEKADDSSLNFIVVVAAALYPGDADRIKVCLGECVRVLKNGGLIFVQGRLDYLPELGVYHNQHVGFKCSTAIVWSMT